MLTRVQDEQQAPAVQGVDQRIHLFVLIDALGWEYIKERRFLNDVLPYRGPLRTVLGFSSGAIPTILTGAWPSVTGHWNLFYYDPKGSPFRWLKYFSFVPDRIMNCRVTTKVLKEMGKHMLGLGPLFDCCVSPSVLRWFNWVERKNIYERGGISGAASIFDHLEKNGVPHRVYTYHHWTDAEIIKLVDKDIAAKTAQFYFVYLSEMDMFLHTHCADEKRIDERIAWYETQLRQIYESARAMDPDATLTIFSDHGMTPISNRYDLMKDVASTGYASPEDYLAVYDSTMARFWFFADGARQDISGVLENTPCGRILSDAELRALGVFFEDRRFGELVFLLNPGWIFSKSDFNGPQWMPEGMHGYHPEEDRYSDAIFLTNQEPLTEVRTIRDVHECMRRAVLPMS
jgi:predicted AlkP superfamily pyrophosphatase or phosphodiesterase